MVENPWDPFRIRNGIENLVKDQVQEQLRNATEVFQKAISENKELSALLGSGDGDRGKIDPNLGRSASAPAPASTPTPSRSSSTSSLNRADSGKAKVAQSLGRSASSPASTKAASTKAASTSSLNRSASASSAPASTKAASTLPPSRSSSTSTLGPADSISSQGSKALSNKSSSSFFARIRPSFLSDPNASQSNSPSRAPSTTPSRANSTTSSRGPSKDNLRKEDGGNKLPFLKRVSSGLSKWCTSSLSGGGGVCLDFEVSRRGEIFAKGEAKISSPSLPSLPSTPSLKRVKSGFVGLRRGASDKLGRVSEAISDARRNSSSLGENWRDVRDAVRSLGDFSSGGSPSSSFSPNSFTNLGSGATRYKEDAKAALRETGSFAREASSQAREALGSLARSTSGWSARGSISWR